MLAKRCIVISHVVDNTVSLHRQTVCCLRELVTLETPAVLILGFLFTYSISSLSYIVHQPLGIPYLSIDFTLIIVTMSGLNVLISGSGIAGNVLAFWLIRAGANVTIIERDSELRRTGQSIDIRGCAVDVIEMMGLKSQLDAAKTSEKGLKFVDTHGKDWAVFPTTGKANQQSFSSEYEVLRGELAGLFSDAIQDRVEWIFGDSISEMQQNGSSCTVSFTSGRAPRTFSLVVGADGLRSSTRSKAFNVSPLENLDSMGAFAAYFTIDKDLLGSTDPDLARWYAASGGRLILLRPGKNDGKTRATLIKQTDRSEAIMNKFRSTQRAGHEAFKDLVEETWHDAGWIADEVLAGMRASSDFYSGEIAQIKTTSLSKGRVVLVGDAAFGAWTLTGMGTTLAIMGAYVLAGEICENADDLDTAFQKYEEFMLPYANEVRDIRPNLPFFVYPQKEWQVRLLYFFLWLVWVLDLKRLLRPMAKAFQENNHQLPEYEKWVEDIEINEAKRHDSVTAEDGEEREKLEESMMQEFGHA